MHLSVCVRAGGGAAGLHSPESGGRPPGGATEPTSGSSSRQQLQDRQPTRKARRCSCMACGFYFVHNVISRVTVTLLAF